MKWKRHRSSRACPNQPLAELIRDELDERQCERLAAHLDDCQTCQQRLTDLTADSRWWLDAGRWLDPTDGDSDGDCYGDHDSSYSNPERELLASGLLTPTDRPDLIGTLGRYEVHSVLGAGGTGIVLKANDVELNRTVAIKVLSPVLAASGAARRRFAREAQAVAAVAHENVIAVHQVEGGGRLPFLVMQYVDGDSLQDLIVREGPLDVTTALRMTAQIASALSAAHDQGLVHRDVKPANILVGAAGGRVWITDFGLARAVDDASLTRTGFIAGTPHYMSPEQARGEVVRASSDLFGLGSVLYFMLTGRPPFRAERTLAILSRICNEPHRPVREVNPDVPRAIAELVDQLLSKSSEDRIPEADTVRIHCLRLLAALAEPDGDLNQIELGARVDDSTDEFGERGDRRSRLRYGVWTVLLLGLGGASLSVGAYIRQNGQEVAEQTGASNGVSDSDPDVFAVADTTGPQELFDSVVASGGLESAASEFIPPQPAINSVEVESAAELVGETTSNWQSPAGRLANEEPPVSAGVGSVLSTSHDVPTEVPPSELQLQPSAEQVASVHGESSWWEIRLNELRASLQLFETQIVQPPGNRHRDNEPALLIVPDAFGQEQYRMEVDLRSLESLTVPRLPGNTPSWSEPGQEPGGVQQPSLEPDPAARY